MREELFVSGRNIPNIDPYLNIWHWQIPIYLFLGGVAAGILFFAGIFTILGKENKMAATVKKAPLLVPFPADSRIIYAFPGPQTQTLFLAALHNNPPRIRPWDGGHGF